MTIKFSFPPASGSMIGEGRSGGYYFDPDPVQKRVNYFPAEKAGGVIGTKDIAEASRDAELTTDDEALQAYKDDSQRMILLHWRLYDKDHFEQQSLLNFIAEGETDPRWQWVPVFSQELDEFVLGTHSVTELKDGKHLTDLVTSNHEDLIRIGDNLQRLNDAAWEVDPIDHNAIKTKEARGNIHVMGNTSLHGNTLISGNLILNGKPLAPPPESMVPPNHFDFSTAIQDADIKYDATKQKMVIDCEKVKDHFESDGSILIDSTKDDTGECKIKLTVDDIRSKVIDELIGNSGIYTSDSRKAIQWTKFTESGKAYLGTSLINDPLQAAIKSILNVDGTDIITTESGTEGSKRLGLSINEANLKLKVHKALISTEGSARPILKAGENITIEEDPSTGTEPRQIKISATGGGSGVTYEGKPVKTIRPNAVTFVSNDGELNVGAGAATYIGYYENFQAFVNSVTNDPNELWRNMHKGLTYFGIRKSAIGDANSTQYVRIYRYMPTTDPMTPTRLSQVTNVANWNHDVTLGNQGYGITPVGENSEYTSWTPEGGQDYSAEKHQCQIVFYNTTNLIRKGFYYSNGTIWRKLHIDTTASSVQIDNGDKLNMGTLKLSSKVATYDSASDTVTLNPLQLVATNGHDAAKDIAKLKAGDNVSIVNTDGTATINANGNVSASINEGVVSSVTAVKLTGETGTSSISNGTLTINIPTAGGGGAAADNSIDVDGYDFNGEATSLAGRKKIHFDKELLVAQENTNDVRVGIRHEGASLGIFNSFSDMTTQALKHKQAFNVGRVTGGVTKSYADPTNTNIAAITFYAWKSVNENPSPTDIQNPNNWTKVELSAAEYPFLRMGTGSSSYPNWTPTTTSTFPPDKAVGQIVTYKPSGGSIEWYYSDGINWKRAAIEGSGSSILIDGNSNTGAVIENFSASEIEFHARDFDIRPDNITGKVVVKTKGTVVTKDDETPITHVHGIKFKGNATVTKEGEDENHIAVIDITPTQVKGSDVDGTSFQTASPLVEFDSKTFIATKLTDASTGKVRGVKVKAGFEISGKDASGASYTKNAMSDLHIDGNHKLEEVGGATVLTLGGVGVKGVKGDGTQVEEKMIDKLEFVNCSLNVTGSGTSKSIAITPNSTGGGGSGSLTVKGVDPANPSTAHTQTDVNYIDFFEGGTRIENKVVDGKNHLIVKPGMHAHTPEMPESNTATFDRIDILGDSAYSSVQDGELILNIQAPTCYVGADKVIENIFPAQKNMHRIGFKHDDEHFYYNKEGSWEGVSFAYMGMDHDVKSLTHRFPQVLNEQGTPSYSDEQNKFLGYISMSEVGAQSLGIPVPEFGVLHNIYASDPTSTSAHWNQKFYGMVTGTEWTRFRVTAGSGMTWGAWERISRVNHNCYSVLICENDKTLQNIISAEYNNPFLVHTDPMANIIPVPKVGTNSQESFKVVYEGMYDITVRAQFTWTGTTEHIPDPKNYSINFFKGTDLLKQVTVPITMDGSKNFPPVEALLKDIKLEPGSTYSWGVGIGNQTVGEDVKLQLDPYKNILAIDPAKSLTQTGRQIARTLYETLGGISFHTGYEVRSEAGTGSSVRVYGEKYRTDLQTGEKE